MRNVRRAGDKYEISIIWQGGEVTTHKSKKRSPVMTHAFSALAQLLYVKDGKRPGVVSIKWVMRDGTEHCVAMNVKPLFTTIP